MQTWAHLVFEPTPVSGGTWTASAAPEAGVLRAAGAGDVGGWVGFAPGTTEVTVRVSLSHVDSDGARMNHEAQLADRDFVAVEGQAEAAWSALLGGVRVQGGTEEQRVIFHTAMYHAALWPNRFQDVDGRYRGVDGEVHTADFDYHSNFSMWDTFRTTHPWFMLTQPETQADMARSLVRMVRDGGHMPRWALGHGYTGGMVGTPAAQILAGTALKGITGWDQDLAFDACFRHSTEATAEASRGGIADYLALGYVPIETSGGSASLGVEYSWNDHALWRWAEQLGRTREAAVLSEQQHNWQNHWDPSQGFIVGRYADGQFRALGNPVNWLEDYIEGNAWHYLWPAPYDVEAMVALQHDGDTDAFVAALDTYWAKVETEPDDAFPDDYYWHGNEPDLHHAWLGALVGHPEATQGPVRHIMETRYSAEPDGLDGNDDAGTLSSWYLFAAIGLYPVAGTPTYAIASPIFERVEIDRPDGTLVIEVPGVEPSPETPAQVHLGGEPLDGWTVDHADLVAAGGLVFEY
jgi:predicted alpha-1,2-mannosidase